MLLFKYNDRSVFHYPLFVLEKNMLVIYFFTKLIVFRICAFSVCLLVTYCSQKFNMELENHDRAVSIVLKACYLTLLPNELLSL